jgi:hypothetical protein
MSLLVSAAALGGFAISAAAENPQRHVLIISIDGFHQADLRDPALAADMPNILELAQQGIEYTHATCAIPSDSFPGSAAYFTGATPRTTGIYFDDTFCRSFRAPGSGLAAPLGAEVPFTGAVDVDSQRLDGGADSGFKSIDADKLPLAEKAGKLVPVYPHNYLKVNTIFEVAHEAGMRTAIIDKHPCYDLAAGPSGKGIDDLYGPESDAELYLYQGQLLDYATVPPAKADKLKKLTKKVSISNAFDDLRLKALLNQIAGKDARGATSPGVPALFAFNFVAFNTAQKLDDGGIEKKADGTEGAVSEPMHEALRHVDQSIAQVVAALKAQHIFDSTLVILTAKHGQSCRLGFATTLPVNTFNSVLRDHNIYLNHATQDDVGLYWLKDQNKAAQAAALLTALPAKFGIDEVLWGQQLVAAGFGDPAADDRAPDIIIKLKPEFLIHDSSKRAEHGGFSEDDLHVALILAGALPPADRGSIQNAPVQSTQIAVTALQALGLNPAKLQGAQIEKTAPLPGI